MATTTSAMRSFRAVGRSSARCFLSSARNENVYDLLDTNPARCAASCTESLNISVLSSCSALSSSPPVKSCVIEAAASAAAPVPR